MHFPGSGQVVLSLQLHLAVSGCGCDRGFWLCELMVCFTLLIQL